MRPREELLAETAEDLYENAPCGYLSTRPDGTIVRVNSTFLSWIGRRRQDLLERKRFPELLAPGDRIYYETHFAPLLQMQGAVREIAVEIVRADGSRLPALINSVLHVDKAGVPQVVRTTVFDASDRRRYESELLQARREQQEIALELQRGLLSKTLPGVDGLELDVAYRPAKYGTEVGGDWYDAFQSGAEEESTMLVVGDVVGRGIGAAAEMGQLRSAVRAFAATGMGPARILGALDLFSERHQVGQLATLVCAELAGGSGILRFACAGHLPPLLMTAQAPPRYLWEGRSPPLAAVTTREARPEAEASIPPESTLVLYTDGLVERRYRGIDPGLELLRVAVATRAQQRPGVLAGELIRALHDPDHADDVCLLVARTGTRGAT